jgi:hypothetical protein
LNLSITSCTKEKLKKIFQKERERERERGERERDIEGKRERERERFLKDYTI